jgi:hypothetical protein
MELPVRRFNRRIRRIPVGGEGQYAGLTIPCGVQYRTDFQGIGRTGRRIAIQKSEYQISQPRCDAALTEFRRHRHRPKFDGSPQDFLLLLIQTA